MNADIPLLVFLHEGLGSIRQWKDFPAQVCERLQLPGLVYDRQGFGKSADTEEKRKADYLHRSALEELPALLETEQLYNPLILVGHSDGGSIALIYAAAFGEKVRAVITLAAHAFVEKEAIEGIQKVVEWYENGPLKPRLEKFHGRKTDRMFYAWADTWRSETFKEWNIMGLLPKISAPSLIIQGKEDEFASREHPEIIARYIGGPSVVFMPENCGHMPHTEAAEMVIEKIRAFLRAYKLIAKA